MFGWLKRLFSRAYRRRAEEDKEIALATERMMVMLHRAEERRAVEQLAKQEADQARARRKDAEWARAWELARRVDQQRYEDTRLVVQQMAAQRQAKQGRPPIPVPVYRRATDAIQPSEQPPAAPSIEYVTFPELRYEVRDVGDAEEEVRPPSFIGGGGSFDGAGASGDWSTSSDSGSCSSDSSSSSSDSGGGSCGSSD